MPKDYFWIDGQRCDDVGIQLQGPVTFSSAAPKLSTISVPGRNGDLHFYEGSFSNVMGEVSCFVLQKIRANEALNAITKWTLLYPGYHRLEVSDEPEHFREARVISGPENEMRAHILAPFRLSFDCKPQKFLKSGQRAIHLQQSGQVLRNPGFTSLPLLIVHGSGPATLSVGDIVVQFSKDFGGSITLDCETQNAYNGYQNKNSVIDAPIFPNLPSGESSISWEGGITRIDITPRWWTL